MDYRAPGADAEALKRRGWFEAMRETLEESARGGSVADPVQVLRALRSHAAVSRAWIGPDMRHRAADPA